MSITGTNHHWKLTPAGDGNRYSKYPDGNVGPPPQTLDGPALFSLAGNEQADGTIYPGSGANRMQYDTGAPGGYGIKTTLSLGQPPATCGGATLYGGRFSLATQIPQGYNIWYKVSVYLPSTLPMGYCFGGSDSAEASTCGKPADGNGQTKFLVMSQDQAAAGRMYFNLRTPRRAMGLDNGCVIISEVGAGAPVTNTTYVIPRDAWFTMQMHIYAHSTAGFVRAWVDEDYIGQLTKNTLSTSGRKIKEWGIGNYWNGVPWTDGGGTRTDHFWIRDVIIATDYTGYGAPLSSDSGGRTYINPELTVADL